MFDKRPCVKLTVGCLLGVLLLLAAFPDLASGPLVADGTIPSASWRSGGPYRSGVDPPESVKVHSIAASPDYAADHTLFAASTAGFYRTTDGGAKWQLVLAPPVTAPATQFTHVRLSPTYATDHIIFAVGVDPDSGVATLYFSSNGGDDWFTRATFTETVTILAISPAFAQDQTLFAVTGAGDDLQKSVDGGVTWRATPLAPPEDGFIAYRLAPSPAYAVDQTLFVTGFGRLRRSVDGGATWQPLAAFGPSYGLAISPAFTDDGQLWITYRAIEAPGDETPENAVLRSTDRGDTWAITNTGLPGLYEPFARTLAISPAYDNDQTLFTALSGQLVAWPHHSIFRSYNGGTSWVDLGAAPDDPDVYDLAVTHTVTEGLLVHVATVTGVWHYGGLAEERLINGGFETASAWQLPVTPYQAAYSTARAHSGLYSMRTGIVEAPANVHSYSSAQQTVTIPAGVTAAHLSFWWYPASTAAAVGHTADRDANRLAQSLVDGILPTTPQAPDQQYLLLLDEKGALLQRLLWTRSNARTWQHSTFDLLPYAGQTVRVHVGVYNNGMDGVTAMDVDDVSLVIGWPGAMAAMQYLPLIR